MLGAFGLNALVELNIEDDVIGRVAREGYEIVEALKAASSDASGNFRVAAANGQALTASETAASERLYKRLKNEVQPDLLELLKSSKYVKETVLLERAKEASVKLENFVKFLEGVEGSAKKKLSEVGLVNKKPSMGEKPKNVDNNSSLPVSPKSTSFSKPSSTASPKLPIPPKKNSDLPRPVAPRTFPTSSASRAPLSRKPLIPVAVPKPISPSPVKPPVAKPKASSLPPLPGPAKSNAPKLPPLPSASLPSAPLKIGPKPTAGTKPTASAPTNFPAPPGMPPKRGGPPF